MLKKIIYEKVLYEWLNSKKNIKQSTYNKYLGLIDNHIIDGLGKISFKKLKYDNIILFFEKKEIKTLSNSTKNTILLILNSSIKYGVERKYRKPFKSLDIRFKKTKMK